MSKNMKPATTNKVKIIYNNGSVYTIPRVYNFKVSSCGKFITGSYTKTVKEHGVTLNHIIDFSIDLVDVVEFSYDAQQGEVSSHYGVIGGRINVKTEFRNEDDFYNQVKAERIWADITKYGDCSSLLGAHRHI